MVLLPEPDTPITTSAQGFSLASSLTEILRQRSLIRQPDRLAGGSRTIGGQVLAIQYARQDRTLIGAGHLEQHLAAGAERRQGQRHPWHERLDMGPGHADHPAFDLLDGRIIRKQRCGMAVGPDPISTRSNSGREETNSFAP